MEYTPLGRTGLTVSVMGLGSGGRSRIGQGQHKHERDSINLVRYAYELGINFFDTSHDYKTEAIIGKALQPIRRDRVVISTKVRSHQNGYPIRPQTIRTELENSLRQLRTDYIDLYHLASVQPGNYLHTLTELVPTLLDLRDEGKIRFLGITEKFDTDTRHLMLERAIEDSCWDVVMVGFNLLNQSARTKVLAQTRAKNIGVLGMFAVRRALSNSNALKGAIADLIKQGQIDPNDFDDLDHPLDFLIRDGSANSLQDAAYRYCRHEPGLDVVLFGTGNPRHLEANVRSLLRPPLPESDRLKLNHLFGQVDAFSGN
jgi:aryl-alcohol dehydrogenase-like predicted oxidoreductase